MWYLRGPCWGCQTCASAWNCLHVCWTITYAAHTDSALFYKCTAELQRINKLSFELKLWQCSPFWAISLSAQAQTLFTSVGNVGMKQHFKPQLETEQAWVKVYINEKLHIHPSTTFPQAWCLSGKSPLVYVVGFRFLFTSGWSCRPKGHTLPVCVASTESQLCAATQQHWDSDTSRAGSHSGWALMHFCCPERSYPVGHRRYMYTICWQDVCTFTDCLYTHRMYVDTSYQGCWKWFLNGHEQCVVLFDNWLVTLQLNSRSVQYFSSACSTSHYWRTADWESFNKKELWCWICNPQPLTQTLDPKPTNPVWLVEDDLYLPCGQKSNCMPLMTSVRYQAKSSRHPLPLPLPLPINWWKRGFGWCCSCCCCRCCDCSCLWWV